MHALKLVLVASFGFSLLACGVPTAPSAGDPGGVMEATDTLPGASVPGVLAEKAKESNYAVAW
jgi:hypothetical protein